MTEPWEEPPPGVPNKVEAPGIEIA